MTHGNADLCSFGAMEKQGEEYTYASDFRSLVRSIASRRGKAGFGETMFRLAVLCLTAAFGVGVLLYIMFN